ncbi:MAG TPA: TOBE domain-containing protein, partial [Stellaceae bacterium]|nr:TOBE domain-containing protein [Stellaceae bacterium]
ASRIAVMERGRIAQLGAAADIYERPQSRFVADFVGAVNLFDGVLVAGFNALALAVTGLDVPIPLPPDTAVPKGTEAALAVRPEKLRLATTRPDGIAIAATVTSVNYQGGISIVHLSSASGHALKAQMSSAAAAKFERSAPVWAGWDPADGVVLAR